MAQIRLEHLTNMLRARSPKGRSFAIHFSQQGARQPDCKHVCHTLVNTIFAEQMQPGRYGRSGSGCRLIWPEAWSADAWHFDRHNFAGWGATDWELLVAVSLASGTTFCVQTQAIIFRVQD